MISISEEIDHILEQYADLLNVQNIDGVDEYGQPLASFIHARPSLKDHNLGNMFLFFRSLKTISLWTWFESY